MILIFDLDKFLGKCHISVLNLLPHLPVNFCLPLYSGVVYGILPLGLCDPHLLVPVNSCKGNHLLVLQVNRFQQLFLILPAHCAPVCTRDPPLLTQCIQSFLSLNLEVFHLLVYMIKLFYFCRCIYIICRSENMNLQII